jgi:hypothetical protein
MLRHDSLTDHTPDVMSMITTITPFRHRPQTEGAWDSWLPRRSSCCRLKVIEDNSLTTVTFAFHSRIHFRRGAIIRIGSNDWLSAQAHGRLKGGELEVSSKLQDRKANAFRCERMTREMKNLSHPSGQERLSSHFSNTSLPQDAHFVVKSYIKASRKSVGQLLKDRVGIFLQNTRREKRFSPLLHLAVKPLPPAQRDSDTSPLGPRRKSSLRIFIDPLPECNPNGMA